MSRTNWGLALFGARLTIGGVAGAMAAIYDVSTGRATVGEVVKDIGIFIEGWIAGLIAPVYDAELENIYAYALFLLLIPGLLLVWYNSFHSSSGATNSRSTPTDRYPCAEVAAGNRWWSTGIGPLPQTARRSTSHHRPTAHLQLCCGRIASSSASTVCACPTRSAPSSSGGFWPAAAS